VVPITVDIPAPADKPVTNTRFGSTVYLFMRSFVMPAISAGSPAPRFMFASVKKFQQRMGFLLVDCSGYATMNPSAAATASKWLSVRNAAAVSVHPCRAMTSGTGVPAL
jgi:hypothetical protein